MKPEKIKHLADKHALQLSYNDSTFELPAEYLRVFSPSAEVQGHGNDKMKIVEGKKFVAISGLEMSGHYALKISFDDGHDSGIYTWKYLRGLCEQYQQKWSFYLNELKSSGLSREPKGLGDIMIKNVGQ